MKRQFVLGAIVLAGGVGTAILHAQQAAAPQGRGGGREVVVPEAGAVDLDHRFALARDLVPELDPVHLRLACHNPSRLVLDGDGDVL